MPEASNLRTFVGESRRIESVYQHTCGTYEALSFEKSKSDFASYISNNPSITQRPGVDIIDEYVRFLGRGERCPEGTFGRRRFFSSQQSSFLDSWDWKIKLSPAGGLLLGAGNATLLVGPPPDYTNSNAQSLTGYLWDLAGDFISLRLVPLSHSFIIEKREVAFRSAGPQDVFHVLEDFGFVDFGAVLVNGGFAVKFFGRGAEYLGDVSLTDTFASEVGYAYNHVADPGQYITGAWFSYMAQYLKAALELRRELMEAAVFSHQNDGRVDMALRRRIAEAYDTFLYLRDVGMRRDVFINVPSDVPMVPQSRLISSQCRREVSYLKGVLDHEPMRGLLATENDPAHLFGAPSAENLTPPFQKLLDDLTTFFDIFTHLRVIGEDTALAEVVVINNPDVPPIELVPEGAVLLRMFVDMIIFGALERAHYTGQELPLKIEIGYDAESGSILLAGRNDQNPIVHTNGESLSSYLNKARFAPGMSDSTMNTDSLLSLLNEARSVLGMSDSTILPNSAVTIYERGADEPWVIAIKLPLAGAETAGGGPSGAIQGMAGGPSVQAGNRGGATTMYNKPVTVITGYLDLSAAYLLPTGAFMYIAPDALIGSMGVSYLAPAANMTVMSDALCIASTPLVF